LVRYAIFLGVGRSEPRALRLRMLAHELESGCEVAAPSLANPVKSLFRTRPRFAPDLRQLALADAGERWREADAPRASPVAAPAARPSLYAAPIASR